MITDNSGVAPVGLALLKANLDKLTPPKSVGLIYKGNQQYLQVVGPGETFESISFTWSVLGPSPELVTALGLLGVEPPDQFPDSSSTIRAYPKEVY